MIRVCVAGVTGWTGSAIAAAVEAAADLELASGVARSDASRFSSVAEALDAAPADVLVDYTHASVVGANVRAALGTLPQKHAAALVLRHSGLSYAEVAAALSMSPGSVGTTVRRAESALRKELNGHASSE